MDEQKELEACRHRIEELEFLIRDNMLRAAGLTGRDKDDLVGKITKMYDEKSKLKCRIYEIENGPDPDMR
jgi:hypothetical protein